MVDYAKLPIPQSDHSMPSWSMLRSAPGPFIQAGDALRLKATTTDSSGTLTCAYRMLTKANNDIVVGSADMVFSGTGTQTAIIRPLAEGWIIGLWVGISSGTITDGEVQASVDVVQNVGATAFPVMSLCSGEVTNIRSLGLGAFDTISGAATNVSTTPTTDSVSSPAAGAEFTITVPAAETWDFIALRAKFVTSGAAANREPSLLVDDGTNVIYQMGTTSYQIATRTFYWQFANIGTLQFGAGTNNDWIIPFPSIRLTAGYRLRSVVGAIQAADQWSEIVVHYNLIS